MKRIAIVGSRKYPHRHAVEYLVESLAAKSRDVIIVSGGAPGVDTWAETTAKRLGLKTEIYLADWDGKGRAAGFLRNSQIVENSDTVIAFWDGVSKGTEDTIQKAKAVGKLGGVITS